MMDRGSGLESYKVEGTWNAKEWTVVLGMGVAAGKSSECTKKRLDEVALD